MKRFKFRTTDKITLIIVAKDQTEAIVRMAELVKSVKDWPVMKVFNLRQKANKHG